LDSATSLVKTDPVTAYVVAYDAARHACTALLAEQGLRATVAGGHVAVEIAVNAQFLGVFSNFRAMRRRRHELDYPSSDEDFADAVEASRGIERSTGIVDSARKILDTGQLTPI
jgi:hypothetical protein